MLPQMVMDISVRGIHNNIIKPFENGGLVSVVYSMTQKVLISYTTLRSFILPQVCKMTPKSRQICGCEICITPNNMQFDLNRFRTIIVIYLQQKFIRIHTSNSLFSTTSAAYYKDKLFPDGEFLNTTIKDVDQVD